LSLLYIASLSLSLSYVNSLNTKEQKLLVSWSKRK
jgi:hypothetical protein